MRLIRILRAGQYMYAIKGAIKYEQCRPDNRAHTPRRLFPLGGLHDNEAKIAAVITPFKKEFAENESARSLCDGEVHLIMRPGSAKGPSRKDKRRTLVFRNIRVEGKVYTRANKIQTSSRPKLLQHWHLKKEKQPLIPQINLKSCSRYFRKRERVSFSLSQTERQSFLLVAHRIISIWS